ncbi:MAG: protein kinase [Elusimicrobia bacterium]|nr:protein kinase [Elusimicrobiota bacterium]
MRSVALPLILALLAPAPGTAADDPPSLTKKDPAPIVLKPLPDTGNLRVRFGILGFNIGELLNPKPKPEETPAPAAPPGAAAPAPAPQTPGPGDRIGGILSTAQQDLLEAEEDEDRAATVVNHAVAQIGEVLTEPPPPNVDRTAYNAARNQAGQMLNSLGGDKNRAPFEQSLRLSQSVLESDSDDRDALNNAAGANFGLGRYREAVDAATRVTERHKDDERAYTTRALANFQMKDYNQAYEDASMALSLNPNNKTAFQVAKLAKPRTTTATDLGLGAADQHLADRVQKEYEGMIDERGRAEAAAKAPAAAEPRRSEPGLEALKRSAAGKIKIGDYKGAAEEADRVLQKDPGNPDALQTRAAAASLLGDYERAVADAGAALASRPNSIDSLLTRAQAYSQLGRHDKALLDADRAVSLKNDDPYAYKTRARAKEGLGNLSGMLDDYREAARYGPKFDAELQEVTSKYGFRLERDGRAAPAAAPEAPRGKGRLAFMLVTSILGVLLVAWGLLHVAIGSSRKPSFAGIGGASPETAKALAAAGGLGAGYEIKRTLGQGGMGVVYEAMDKALERRVAVNKMRDEIRLDERERARFLQEARIVAQLHHPNIVEIHTIVSEGDDLYLVFEFVEGHTVDQILGRKGRLSVSEAQWVMHGVSKALEYAHAHGVVHRDLKPSNIMIEKDGAVKVMDFGIARQAKDALARSTMTGTVAGTPQYMAPEQEEGVVRPESDVFSLGAMLYEMVTGTRPYPAPATTASKVNKRYEKPSRLQADLPPELERLIDDCLEPDPEKRPRTAAEFRGRLSALKGGSPAKSA